jgi:DNA-binding protein YbaB
MPGRRREDLDEAYAELERSKAALTGLQTETLGHSTTVTSKNRDISVTVDGRGEVTGIKFHTRSFRIMPATELASLLVETIGEARRASLTRVAAAFESMLPAGLPLSQMMSGTVDVEAVLNDALARMPRNQKAS